MEVCIAAVLLGLNASAVLGSMTAARRDATLAAMRQTAIVLAEQRIEALAIADGPDESGWLAQVSAALPGGSGSLSVSGDGTTVAIRWNAPGAADSACPGRTCVTLRRGT